jgi:hypothetical protein
LTIKADEHERRYKIYREHRTVEEMALAAGLKYSSFRAWMIRQGLKPHPDVGQKKRTPTYGDIKFKKPTYLKDRPEWEKDRMKHFASKLVKAADVMPNETPDVERFMVAYQTEYGCKYDEEVLYG